MICDECDKPHSVSVEFCDERQSYGWYCFQHGFIEKHESELRAFRVNIDALVARIGAAIGSGSAQASRLSPHVHKICRFNLAESDVALYLLVGDLNVGISSIAREMASEPQSYEKLLISPSKDNVPGWSIKGASLVRLSDAIEIDASLGVSADPWRLAQYAGIRTTKKPGRVSPYQPMLDELIESRDREEIAEEFVKTEASAIQAIWPSKNFTTKVPGTTTVADAIRKYRGVEKGQD